MRGPDETAGRKALGTVGNLAVLERELGKVEYRIVKLEGILGSALAASEAAALRAELEELLGRRRELIRLLDQENARLASQR